MMDRKKIYFQVVKVNNYAVRNTMFSENVE